MRTFAAIKIPLNNDQRVLLEELKVSMGNKPMRWVDWSGLHLTLFFFGKTSSALVSSFNLFLKDLTSEIDPFDLTINGLSVFGAASNPKVLWLGIKPCDELNYLQDKISGFATANGFRTSNHGFKPHITLARIKAISNTDNFLRVLKSYNHKIQWQLNVDRIILYKSELNPDGARYSPILWHLL